MSLKKNIIANYLGQGWRALMSFLFIPFYIYYLGVDAYGLIAIFAILQAWLVLLEMGMRPTLIREMARFTSGAHTAQSVRDLLRSFENIGLGVAIFISFGIWFASDWFATDWVNSENIDSEVVAKSFVVMGVVIALRFIENIYLSCIEGLQRQVLQNIIISTMATARGLGAVGVLAWVSPTIEAFFIWQSLISLFTVIVLASNVYHLLPSAPQIARFTLSAFTDIWHFASGMIMITFLTLLLTQIDKILLSRLLPLEDFGYYALAGVVANALYLLAGPIRTAFYPRFTELVTQGNVIELQKAYHQAAQLLTVLMGSAAIVLMFFSERILLLWTADPILTNHVSPLIVVLSLGTLLNGLMWVPYFMQLAHGWTSLTIKTNVFAVTILVPAIIWIVPVYGAIGAAWLWVMLNVVYIIFYIYFMHLRLLPTEKWHWYKKDIVTPLTAALVTASLLLLVLPESMNRAIEFCILIFISGCVLIATIFAAPMVRSQFLRYIPNQVRAIYIKK